MNNRRTTPKNFKAGNAGRGLKEIAEQYRTLGRSIENPIISFDCEGRILYANGCAARAVGKEANDIIGTSVFENLPIQDATRLLTTLDRVFVEKHHVLDEYTLSLNGQKRYFTTTLSPILSENGTVLRVVAIANDITELMQTKHALEMSERRERALLEGAPEAALLMDTQGTILACNGKHAERFNRKPAEMLGTNFWDSIPAELAEKRREKTEEVLRSGKALHDEDEREGRILTNFIQPIANKENEVVQLACFSKDVTRERMTERRLRESEAKYRLLVESMNEGLAVIDENFKYGFVNDRFCKMLGYESHELIGKCPKEFVDAANVRILKRRWDVHNLGDKTPFELVFMRKNGTKLHAMVSPQPLLADEGRFKRGTAVITDITKIKQTEKVLKMNEKVLKAKTRKLEESNAALKVLLEKREEDRREFAERLLSNLKLSVHPYLAKLEKSRLDERQNAYVKILQTNLKNVIGQFVTKLASTYANLTPSEIQVAQLVKEGKTTKEISELLGSSVRAIEAHRERLRKKLELPNRRTNLRSYLLSL